MKLQEVNMRAQGSASQNTAGKHPDTQCEATDAEDAPYGMESVTVWFTHYKLQKSWDFPLLIG